MLVREAGGRLIGGVWRAEPTQCKIKKSLHIIISYPIPPQRVTPPLRPTWKKCESNVAWRFYIILISMLHYIHIACACPIVLFLHLFCTHCKTMILALCVGVQIPTITLLSMMEIWGVRAVGVRIGALKMHPVSRWTDAGKGRSRCQRPENV